MCILFYSTQFNLYSDLCISKVLMFYLFIFLLLKKGRQKQQDVTFLSGRDYNSIYPLGLQ